MEAVRPRPQRAHATPTLQDTMHVSDDNGAVQDTTVELDVIQKPPAGCSTEKKVGTSVRNTISQLNLGSASQIADTEPRLASDDALLPLIWHHETARALPSAPVLQETETEDDKAKPAAIELQPRASNRTPDPRGVDENLVVAEIERSRPSAPLETAEPAIDSASIRPSAPCLSPRRSTTRMSGTNAELVSAGVTADRTAFATSHVVEQAATTCVLYPSLPPQAVNATTPRNEVAYTIQCVPLEPLVNFELQVMRAHASRKRHTQKMRHLALNKGELYARIERYLFAEYILQNALSTLDGMKKQVDDVVAKVWTVEKKRVASTKRCGDNVEHAQHVEFQTAKLEPLQLEQLTMQLAKLRQLRTVAASMHTFDRAVAYVHVEQYVNSVVHEPQLAAFVHQMSVSCGSSPAVLENVELIPETASFYDGWPSDSPVATAVDHLKYSIDVLMFFEKQVTVGQDGVFSRVPPSFSRGEVVWPSAQAKQSYRVADLEQKIKCYACGRVHASLDATRQCAACPSCHAVLYIPPSAVATQSNEWFTSVVRFRKAVHTWISTCLQRLLRVKSLHTMPYLLLHVMYLPRIATDERSWLLRFLQFPRAMVRTDGSIWTAWSEDLVDHYIAMLHLVLHPEQLRRMATVVSSGPQNGWQGLTSAASRDHEKQGAVSTDWVLVENPARLDRNFLSDDDFVAVLNQFPTTFAFEQVFNCIADVTKCYRRALTLVVELTQGLRVFQEFETFPTRLAQLVGQLLCTAAECAGPGTKVDARGYPTLFDQLFLTSVHGFMAVDCNRVAWRSLHVFPYGSVSEVAKWDVLALLLFNVSSLPPKAKCAAGWRQFLGPYMSQDGDVPRNGARHYLYGLVESDTESALQVLHAVASLAASCESATPAKRHELVIVAVHELFLAGFTVEACHQALGVTGERAAALLSTICLAHPWVLSLLLSLLVKYHKCATTWIHIFATFPINRWMPTEQDLIKLQEWLLLEDTSAPRSALARFLLDHINWAYDVKAQMLFTDAGLHRKVALMVAEALVLYKTRQERASVDPKAATGNASIPQPLEGSSIAQSLCRALWPSDTVEFETWCWKLMLKLRFYSAKTHEPLLPLIDLQSDRSREALMLRRWFAGASVLRGLKVFPFFTSAVEPMACYGVDDSTRKRSEGSRGESTGAPRYQESRVLLTPQNSRGLDIEMTAATRTEPIVAYVICQLTTFVLSDRLDRWEPLLVLLKNERFAAAVHVLENLVPILARWENTKEKAHELKTVRVDDTEIEKSDVQANDVARKDGETWLELDKEVEVCMAAMQALSTDEMLRLLNTLHECSYINTDELHGMYDVLHQGYSNGEESTAKEQILAKLRIVRECSRYLHPVALPALLNESFPQSSRVSDSPSALFFSAMSWISSALRSDTRTGALSPSAAFATRAAVSIRNSFLTATTASLASSAGAAYPMATNALCALVRQSFAYAVENSELTQTMEFWAKALLQVPFWYEHAAFRHVVDVMLHASMARSYEWTLTKPARAPCGLDKLVAQLDAAFQVYCQRMAMRKAHAGSKQEGCMETGPINVVSLLPPVAPSAPLAAFFGCSYDVTQYICGCPSLSLWSLLVETRKEGPLFLAMGQLMATFAPQSMTKVAKLKQTDGKLTAALCAASDKRLDRADTRASASGLNNPFAFGHSSLESLSQYKIYRWCTYCLELSESEPLLIIYWQVVCALYFATCGARVFGHHFFDWTGHTRANRGPLRHQLQLKLRQLVAYYSTQAQVVLTAPSRAQGSTRTSTEGKEQQYAHYVALSQLYTAMDAWMEEKDPNEWLQEEARRALPCHYEVERLDDVLRLSNALLSSQWTVNWSDLPLWTQYCGFEFLVPRSNSQSVGENVDKALVAQATPLASRDEEDDFAFVDEASDLPMRHRGVNSTGFHSFTSRPLSLSPDVCGPMSSMHVPTVSVLLSTDRCVLTPSIPLNSAGLKTLATKFSEKLSVLLSLDAEMIDSVSHLYSGKERTVTQSVPCKEGPQCRQPAAFQFDVLEWIKDAHKEESIASIRAQSERCDFGSMKRSDVIAVHEYGQDECEDEAVLPGETAAQFLQLDSDGVMLAHQIVLIDQVVCTLQREQDKLQRLKKTLATDARSTVSTVENAASDAWTPRQQTERELEWVHSKGLEWFRLLTDLDTPLSRLVPPLREALWRSIQQLGQSFVSQDEGETGTLLDLMLQDPARIHLLGDSFVPATAPSQFVAMFAKLMRASSGSSLVIEAKLALLQRFDIRAWLQGASAHRPTKCDRETMVGLILGDVYQQVSAHDIGVNAGPRVSDTTVTYQYDQLLRVAATNLQLICSMHLADHVEQVVHALVGVLDDAWFQTSSGHSRDVTSCRRDKEWHSSRPTAGPRPVDAVVWDALIGLPVTTWKELASVQLEACVSFLSQHMTSSRWQCGISSSYQAMTGIGSQEPSSRASVALTTYPLVYWQHLGVLKSVLDLCTLCYRVAPESQQWPLISLLFEPLLATLYQPATTTKGSERIAPWPDQDILSTGTTICSCFVATCGEYLTLSTGSSLLTMSAKLSQIWAFYVTKVVPHAPPHVCKLIHQFVTRLAWDHWGFTLEIVQQMRDLVQTEQAFLTRVDPVPRLASSVSPYPFISWLVRDLLCRPTGNATEAWLETQSERVRSLFLLEFATLCVALVLDWPHFQGVSQQASTKVLPPYFVNFIQHQTGFWRRWKLIGNDFDTLLQSTVDALLEPLCSQAEVGSADGFPGSSSGSTMHDAFTRLQLVLRLVGQIATLYHGNLSHCESLQRVGRFVKLLFRVLQETDRSSSEDNRRHCAWQTVLYGASCTALYEKLDEMVQYYKPERESNRDAIEAVDDLLDEELTRTIADVLNCCNLASVAKFFQQMHGTAMVGSHGSLMGSSGMWIWSKCGNVVGVEIDAVMRDFAVRHKAVHAKNVQSTASDKTLRVTAITSGAHSPVDALGLTMGKVLWSFVGFRGGELACLAACGRALTSVHVMSHVAEKSIETWIMDDQRGLWDHLAQRLHVPELSSNEFEAACLAHGNLLTLQVLFLQHLRQAPVVTESLSRALVTRLLHWMARARLDSSAFAPIKWLFLAAQVTHVVCTSLAKVLSATRKKQLLRQLCESFLALGHARRNSGLLKAIGLSGSLQYGVEFHVACLAAGIFIRLQTRTGAPLRLDDCVALKWTKTTATHCQALETLLESNEAFSLGRRADAIVAFVRDPRHSLADQDEFFVTLFSSLYPTQGWLLAKCVS